MGTSASFPTPSGGEWTSAKQAVTTALNQGTSASPAPLVAATMKAVGGLHGPTVGSVGGGSAASRGGGGGGGSGGGASRRTASRAVAGVGGFGAAVRDEGLAKALSEVGLTELQGKSAAEVISRVAEQIAVGTEGLLYETVYAAFVQALYDAAELTDNASFENLESALQTFLRERGPEGLAELFLTHYVFGRIWTAIESHAASRADSNGEHEALLRSVHGWSRDQVRDLFDEYRSAGRFENANWFGNDGLRLADAICDAFVSRLAAAAQEAAA